MYSLEISLEPVIFFFVFFNYLMHGAQQKNNLLLDHICRVSLGYSDEICSNRTQHEQEQIEVQRVLNM